MAEFDAEILAVAQELITENGRSVTLIAFDSTEQNAAQPWNGPADPRAVPDATLAVDAVFVDPSSARSLGVSRPVEDLVKRYSAIMMISPGAQVDLSQYQEVLDGTNRSRVESIESLRPGGTTFIHFLGVVR